jgi:hypothetical protein
MLFVPALGYYCNQDCLDAETKALEEAEDE